MAVETFYHRDPNAVPESITDQQFGHGLWVDGIISFDECHAFVSSGAIPAALQTIIDQLPDDDTGAPTPRKTATVLVSGAKSYLRNNPLVEQLAAMLNPPWTSATLDAKWIQYSQY